MSKELREGCFVERLVENNTGLPRAGSPSALFNCDGSQIYPPRLSSMGFGPTIDAPAYEWQWVRDCNCQNKYN